MSFRDIFARASVREYFLTSSHSFYSTTDLQTVCQSFPSAAVNHHVLPRAFSMLADTTIYRYIVNVLEDAKLYSEYANKTEIDESDVRLAIQNRLDHSFTAPPPRE
uniref:Histone H2A/H2B/H3 domain-containing protein n=1 Tax=Amphimedon queenslandica TaxID=400682 RepID=A0A1X7U1K9_AMPQE